MKAVRLHAFNELPKVEDVPEPTVTGPFDVIVRIGGAGLCRTDVHFMQMELGDRSHLLPMTLGHENAGWVQEVGSAVTNVAPGDAVICHPVIPCGLCRACRDGDDVHCTARRSTGLDHDGGFAELLKTYARSVIKLPDGVEPAAVAGHADGGLTAYHAAKKANTMGLLYPGSVRQVRLRVKNLLSHKVRVLGLRLKTGKPSGSCPSWAVVGGRIAVRMTIARRGTRTAYASIRMLTSAPTSCEGATIPLAFSATLDGHR